MSKVTKSELKLVKPPVAAEVSTFSANQRPTDSEPLRRFSRLTSDELGRVLGVLTGLLDYGASSGERGELEAAAAEALGAAEYALTLCRNLGFLTSQTPLEMRMTDLPQLIIDTYVLFEKYLAARQIHPTLLVENAAFVPVDANAMHQVIANLLARASRQLKAGDRLTLALKQTQSETEITYTDTTTIPSGATEDLDLVVARLLVEAHKGKLTRIIRAGVGNTLVITLPFDRSAPQPSNAVSKRRNRRARVTLPVDYQFNGDQLRQSFVVNLSAGGAFITVPQPDKHPMPKLGDELSLRIQCFLNHTVEVAKARVANVRWDVTPGGFGVQFLESDNRTKKILAGIIKGHAY